MFKVTTGDERRVVAIPSLGAVFKFPRIYFKAAFEQIQRGRTRNQMYLMGKKHGQKFSDFLREQLTQFEIGSMWTIRGFLCSGLRSNRSERHYYKKSNGAKRQLLQPTYFSLFGLMNVQKYGVPVRQPRTKAELDQGKRIYDQLFPIAGVDLNEDGHHFAYKCGF